MLYFILGLVAGMFIPIAYQTIIKNYIMNGFRWVRHQWKVDDKTGDVVDKQNGKVVLMNKNRYR